ncbi:MAG TPA: hypothetical protein VJZ49_09685 [Syntrophales bacterium]|nr:hypothetical protein [Syntrophales bacterium]
MKSRYPLMALVVAGLFVFSVESLFSEDTVSMSEWTQIVEKIGNNGNVNWSAGYIEAVGTGAPPARAIGKPEARPMALRAAELDAKRNLLEITKGVRIDSTTVVKDYTVESDIINSQVEGFIKGALVVKKDYMSDGTVEVTVRMPLFGDFSQVIMSKARERRPEAKPPVTPPADVPDVPAAPAAPATPAAPSGPVYTGLVVDARGIQTRPAMAPKILDENGQEVYGSMNVDREYAVQQGVSGYARDLTAAQSNSRVTNNPLTVKGLKVQGQGRSDIVISNADAASIRSAADNLTFMKKCRVMIVLD